ncbi:MAG: hypothetical protein EBT47_13215, partial [Chloroflexi bacterium]|nr:hypothetical protein [Chloroflexota bacterium]
GIREHDREPSRTTERQRKRLPDACCRNITWPLMHGPHFDVAATRAGNKRTRHAHHEMRRSA